MFVARAGRSELTTTVLEPGQLQDLVERMLKSSGRRVDLSQPFAHASWALRGMLDLLCDRGADLGAG